jgi:histone deacetylase complex subunit SAP18
VFPKLHGHHKLEDFSKRGEEPSDEVQIYTWADATLRELTDLVKEVNTYARQRNAKLSFALIYPDKKGRNVMRTVGIVHSSREGEDDRKSLRSLNFQTGDFLDVGIII